MRDETWALQQWNETARPGGEREREQHGTLGEAQNQVRKLITLRKFCFAKVLNLIQVFYGWVLFGFRFSNKFGELY